MFKLFVVFLEFKVWLMEKFIVDKNDCEEIKRILY